MIGKVIQVNDYRFLYGQETVYLNVYAVFKSKRNGDKFVIYSYDNKKLFCGSAFVKEDELVVMTSRSEISEIIKEFINLYFENKALEKYEIISLDNVKSVQIIDESVCDFDVDIIRLYDLTIPKVEVVKKEVKTDKKKKKISFVSICIIALFIVLVVFFFVNPEVIMGKNRGYICSKSYLHKELPASVNEDLILTFNSKGKILSINITSDYVFSDIDYYREFRDKSYFYKYFNDGDTYKFDDSNYTYRLFSKIDTEEEYFLPSDEDELISYYKDNSYECKMIEEE